MISPASWWWPNRPPRVPTAWTAGLLAGLGVVLFGASALLVKAGTISWDARLFRILNQVPPTVVSVLTPLSHLFLPTGIIAVVVLTMTGCRRQVRLLQGEPCPVGERVSVQQKVGSHRGHAKGTGPGCRGANRAAMGRGSAERDEASAAGAAEGPLWAAPAPLARYAQPQCLTASTLLSRSTSRPSTRSRKRASW